jgi:hypothetical protein
MEIEQILLARQEKELEALAEQHYREEMEAELVEEMYKEHLKEVELDSNK